ncbi:unnamed protein product [Vitrella brassicaformis CCMP3155]|uniref:OB domain-containing protein n=1 Tax=Vitrella brassicaformis (strain CCMP3155) TaxID=1169540 RepID=A0A0G4H492_VITBC|nr:unnamed protein product [Vitrella brassicaformis CCMP3155]|eukprot:CEM38574.1 unnamed protein product [Vitrella brassicaformis CCMP3155]
MRNALLCMAAVVWAPITDLRPGRRVGRRAMKGIVTRVSPVKAYRKGDGTQGRMFSLLMTDESGSVKVCVFGNGVLKFSHHPLPGEEFILTNFKVLPAKQEFNWAENAFEVHLDGAPRHISVRVCV